MRANYFFFVLGCILGGLVVGLIVHRSVGPAATPRDESGHDLAFQTALHELQELRTENEVVRTRADLQARRIEELEGEVETLHATPRAKEAEVAREAEEEPAEPLVARMPNEEDVRKAIDEFGPLLQALIVGNPAGKAAAKKLRAILAAAGPEAIQRIITDFEDASVPLGQRIVLAHVLGQSEDSVALEVLQKQLRDPDAGLMLKRFASHGLAFSDAEGLDAFLAQTAREADDLGVRANTAFGLQRRGVAEGVGLYFAATDQAFSNKDPAALQYLGGIRLMGDKAKPYVRERLGSYREEQALLVLIAIAQAFEDREAVPALEKLAYDATRPRSVQTSAQGALKALAKPE